MKLDFLNDKVRHCCLAMAFNLLPSLALAGNGETPVSQGLSYITDALFGKTGLSIATIVMAGVFGACMAHKLEWKVAAYTAGGISAFFGTPVIVETLFKLAGGH